jgi:hypothetical protein
MHIYLYLIDRFQFFFFLPLSLLLINLILCIYIYKNTRNDKWLRKSRQFRLLNNHNSNNHER